MCVCRSFLVSLCMFTVSKAVLMSRATVIVCAGDVILLNPLAIALCSAVIVEWRFFPAVWWYNLLYIVCYVWKKALLHSFINHWKK